MSNVLNPRQALSDAGMSYYGDPSAIVCVKMGTEGLARLVGRRLPALGSLASPVEFPAVPKGAARFRMQVMANHTDENIRDAVECLRTAKTEAEAEMADVVCPMRAVVA